MGLLTKAAILLAEKGWVEFPNLFKNHGLRLNIDDVVFKLGSLEIRWYGLLISGVVVLCIFLGLRSCKNYGIDPNDLLDYLIFSLPAAVIGLRVYYVAFNFEEYRDNIWDIFAFWKGGLAIYGGIIGAALAVFIVAKVKKQKVLKILDFLIGYIALGQAVGRWGNFFNQEAFGGPTKMPWGMTGDKIEIFVRSQGWQTGTLVHPTFLYESLWCFVVFAVIMLYRRSKFKKVDGECLALYMILYGVERMIVEGLRTDSLYIGKTGIRVSQLLSAILVIVGIALFIDFKVRWKKAVYEGTAEGVDAGESGFAAALEEIKGEEAAAETAAEAVADAAADAEETAEDIAASAEETAEDIAAAAEDTAEDIAAAAEETAEDIATDAEETAEKAADAAEDKVNSVFLG